MASMLAIVNKKWLEACLKSYRLAGTPGEVFRWGSYQSQNAHLAKLNGGTLFLVAVRPGGVLWLVAIYEETEMTKRGIETDETNTTPIIDITHLTNQFEFESGNGLSAITGQALQTPRVLTKNDEKLLRAAVLAASPPRKPVPWQPPKKPVPAKISLGQSPSIAPKASMLASFDNLKEIVRFSGKKGQTGEVIPGSSYKSTDEQLAKLNGGALFLVSVRPGSRLWLVFLFETTNQTTTGITSVSPSEIPITDITHLKKQLKFDSGKGFSSGIGGALREARLLTKEDERLLRGATNEALDELIREAELESKETEEEQEAEQETTQEDPEASEFPEGKKVYALHARLERNLKLVDKAKQAHKKKHNGSLPCSVCSFDFAKEYGAVGKDYAEVHHSIPLKDYESQQKETTKVEEMVVVCANCHRMLHRRRPWLTLADLKQLKTPRKKSS
jgi:HNH endonuclease